LVLSRLASLEGSRLDEDLLAEDVELLDDAFDDLVLIVSWR
jgi:hypothetical protein